MKTNQERYVTQGDITSSMTDAEFDSFAQMLKHEVSAPLRAIDAFADLLSREYSQRWDRGGKSYLHHITRASKRLRQLTEDVHRLSRSNSDLLARTTFDLSAMAHSIFDERRSLEPQRHVETRVAQGMSCTADERLMHMALENLIGNAWKYTSKRKGAVIDVGVVNHGGDPLTYFVGDNGVGFEEQPGTDMFEAFRRLHNDAEFQGTGMGLAIVKRIISRHGGTITASGVAGAGARFLFTVGS